PLLSATNLSIFKGTNPNGVWSLYVVDDANMDTGSIAGGWSMTIRTTALFTNSTFIKINDSFSPPTIASPYPSSITVPTNLIGNVLKVTATLNGFAHTYPDDVDILLVVQFLPSNFYENLVLMSDAGGNTPATGLNFTFDDSAAVQMPDEGTLTNGTFLPSNFVGLGSEIFPSPASAPSAVTNLSVFNGKSPNGIWNLYVVDDLGGDAGQIANGWSLSITTEIPAPVIINPHVVGGNFFVTWFALRGVPYQVQRTFNLSSPSWTTVYSLTFADDSLQTYTFPISESSSQFFRVVIPAVVSPAP
ncbi:MAG: hypothetical protein ACR2H1_10785, partial [Limisphaerales bacterium]